jgi:hypothetical protein
LWWIAEHLTNKVNTDIVDIKGRINAIDQIIERNKVTIKEASEALKRSKEEERVGPDKFSSTINHLWWIAWYQMSIQYD